MSSELAVRVHDLGKRYEIYARPHDRLKQTLFRGRKNFYTEFWALRNVSFEVPRGQTLGIIGRNGSGKSTLLQIICGTLTPTTGTVETAGKIAALLELGAGFHPDFTGRENVYLNARIFGLTAAQTDERFDRIASFADIGTFIDQPVKTYSSGMYVRLAFAVIANVDADVLVIDEALAVGDAFFTQKCMRFLRDFQSRGTIIFVSHDSSAVVSLCDHALWLDKGELRASDTAKNVFQKYLEAYHDGAPLMPTEAEKPAAAPVVEPAAEVAAAPASQTESQGFDPLAPAFGNGGATITDVQLSDAQGARLLVIHGGETVTVSITARANRAVPRALIGFFVKDRLGQNLFGENTHATYAETPVSLVPGQVFTGRFTFQMPILQPGDYTITAAVAEGTQDAHTQLHWIHDAYLFRSAKRSESAGLVGIPMLRVELTAEGVEAKAGVAHV